MGKISVIMSIHNGAKTLDASIASILNQTYQDFEVIICDDASTDNTYQKLLEYSKRDSRFIILRNPQNLGLALSLNKCLDRCSGDYIARMDDDDLAFPERFQEQHSFLQMHSQYAFVSSCAIVFDGEKETGILRRPEIPQKKDFLIGTPYVHPATMFKREPLLAVRGYSTKDHARGRAQDYELFMRMAAHGYAGYNIQEPLLRYFITPQVQRKKRTISTVWNEMKIRYFGFRGLDVQLHEYVFILVPLYVYVKQAIQYIFRRGRHK